MGKYVVYFGREIRVDKTPVTQIFRFLIAVCLGSRVPPLIDRRELHINGSDTVNIRYTLLKRARKNAEICGITANI